MINVTLKGGVVRQFESGTTVSQIAKSLGAGLYKAACAAMVDGKVCDLRFALETDCKLEILTYEDEGGRHAFNHTASHILAQAVKRLYPQVKLTIGPAIDNGFYYDFDTPEPFTPEVLEKLEVEMKKIVKEELPLERFELWPDDAIKLMQEKDEPYKLELIGAHASKGENISFYKQGEFTELCAGPHIPDTGRVKALNLPSVQVHIGMAIQKIKCCSGFTGSHFPKLWRWKLTSQLLKTQKNATITKLAVNFLILQQLTTSGRVCLSCSQKAHVSCKFYSVL